MLFTIRSTYFALYSAFLLTMAIMMQLAKRTLRRWRKTDWWDIFFLLLILSPLFFILLGNRPLFTPDEGRYAEIAREMVQSHDYITPHLNGIKYFEKPPLFYWLSAAAIKIGG